MRKFILISLILVTVLAFVGTAQAVHSGKCSGEEIKTILGCAKDLNDFLAEKNGLFDWSFKLLSVLAVAMLIFGGIRYISSAGNPEGIADAKNIISTTLIATAVLILANSIFIIITGYDVGPIGLAYKGILSGVNFTRPGGLIRLTNNIIKFLSIIASPVAAIFLILGGARYMTAGGNPEAVEQAKKMLTAAIIGIIIIITANAAILIIQQALGFK